MIQIGKNSKVQRIYIGNRKVKEVYRGSDLLFKCQLDMPIIVTDTEYWTGRTYWKPVKGATSYKYCVWDGDTMPSESYWTTVTSPQTLKLYDGQRLSVKAMSNNIPSSDVASYLFYMQKIWFTFKSRTGNYGYRKNVMYGDIYYGDGTIYANDVDIMAYQQTSSASFIPKNGYFKVEYFKSYIDGEYQTYEMFDNTCYFNQSNESYNSHATFSPDRYGDGVHSGDDCQSAVQYVIEDYLYIRMSPITYPYGADGYTTTHHWSVYKRISENVWGTEEIHHGSLVYDDYSCTIEANYGDKISFNGCNYYGLITDMSGTWAEQFSASYGYDYCHQNTNGDAIPQTCILSSTKSSKDTTDVPVSGPVPNGMYNCVIL